MGEIINMCAWIIVMTALCWLSWVYDSREKEKGSLEGNAYVLGQESEKQPREVSVPASEVQSPGFPVILLGERTPGIF